MPEPTPERPTSELPTPERPTPEGPTNERPAPTLWQHARFLASSVTVMVGLYLLLVAFDNLTNPASNWGFVKGVLSGDGTPDGNGFEWREIHATWVAVVAYVVIIAGETLSGALLLYGGVRGLARRRAHTAWEHAQRPVFAGVLVGLLVFFLGFMVIGGNWFVMYLNDKWNGMDPAFQNTVMLLFTLTLTLATAVGGRLADHAAPERASGGTRGDEGGEVPNSPL